MPVNRTFPEASYQTPFSEGYVTNTSLTPAVNTTKPPALEEAKTVVRARVVPEAV